MDFPLQSATQAPASRYRIESCVTGRFLPLSQELAA